jgi:hypothetical protein
VTGDAEPTLDADDPDAVFDADLRTVPSGESLNARRCARRKLPDIITVNTEGFAESAAL